MKGFKQSYPLEKRKEIYAKQSQLHPNKIALIVEAHPKSKLALNRFFKLMVKDSYTIGSIQQTVKRELIKNNVIPKSEATALYLFCKQKLLKSSDILNELVNLRDAQDNFLLGPFDKLKECQLHTLQQMNNLAGYCLRNHQILWSGKHCVAFFPQTQILQGHVLITNLGPAYEYSKWSMEEVSECSAISYALNKKLCSHYSTQCSTLFMQVIDKQILAKSFMHIIPRKQNDLANNDDIYKALESFPKLLLERNREIESKPQLQSIYWLEIDKLKESLNS